MMCFDKYIRKSLVSENLWRSESAVRLRWKGGSPELQQDVDPDAGGGGG